MLQPVSVQSAAGASQAATATALPPLLPQGILFFPQGFIGFLKAELSLVDPIANSSIAVFPRELIHSFNRFSIIVALYGDLKSSSIFDEQVVGTQISQKISLTAIGTPESFHSQVLCNQPLFIKLKTCSLSSYFSILF
jgi:hypothetical protein